MSFIKKQSNLFISKGFVFYLLIIIFIFLVIFYFRIQQVSESVWHICQFSQSKYEGDCVETLANFVDDENQKTIYRNEAIWALGKLGDKRADWVISKYRQDNPEILLSQIELDKASKLISKKYNLTTWLWQDKKFFLSKTLPIVENSSRYDNYLVEGVFPVNESKIVKLLFFGDLMLDRHVLEKIKQSSLDNLLHKLKDDNFTEGYDIVLANLEGAVTSNGDHYQPYNLYDFAFKPDIVSQLKDYNFNFFTLANNHLSDQGDRGIKETYLNLNKLGFNYVGCQDASLEIDLDNIPIAKISHDWSVDNLSLDNCSARITEINGYKLGFLSFSIVYRGINEADIISNVKELKKQVDWLIVMPHWGIEYQSLAASSQVNLARKMIDSGADAVIGHHPHVIQNYEVYRDKPIFYSLGNFVFDQYFSPETQEGLAVSLFLEEDKDLNFEIFKLKSRGSRIESIEKQLFSD